jgi:hypothetical protein
VGEPITPGLARYDLGLAAYGLGAALGAGLAMVAVLR